MASTYPPALHVVAGLWLAAAAVAPAAAASVTLDDAVVQVQQRTGGKVLSAEPRHVGRRLEYRIKVLTPDGHVRVVAISPDSSASSTKQPAGDGAGNKEN